MIRVANILCPTDFSEFSERALRHAGDLARWYEAHLTVLHVVPIFSPIEAMPVGVGPVPGGAVRREAVHEELERFIAPAKKRGSPVDYVVAEGSAVEQVLSHAEQLPADLIVMGAHGRSGFERFVLGSVTEKVLRKAPCPVLTVQKGGAHRPEAGEPPFRRIVCGVDFSETSLRALEYSLSLAQEDDASITLAHVVESLPETGPLPPGFDLDGYRRKLREELLERLKGFIPEHAPEWCKPEAVVAEGKAWAELLRIAKEHDADLLVLGVHGRGPLDRLLFGSTTSQVVRRCEAPVLSIRSRT
jgi:nucleotide-binding universal stress UspA family protein